MNKCHDDDDDDDDDDDEDDDGGGGSGVWEWQAQCFSFYGGCGRVVELIGRRMHPFFAQLSRVEIFRTHSTLKALHTHTTSRI